MRVWKDIIHSRKCSVIAMYIRIWRDKKLLTWWDNKLWFCVSCIAKFRVPREKQKDKKYFQFTSFKVEVKQSHTTATFSGVCFQVPTCWEENSAAVSISGVVYFLDGFSLQILGWFLTNYWIRKLSFCFLFLLTSNHKWWAGLIPPFTGKKV